MKRKTGTHKARIKKRRQRPGSGGRKRALSSLRPPPFLPRIVVTMGDAGGIGPEVALKALARRSVRRACVPAIAGDFALLRRVARRVGTAMPPKKLKGWEDITDDTIGVIDTGSIKGRIPIGSPSRAAGLAAWKALGLAVQLACSGEAEGLVTAPVSKESFEMAGYGMVGHTELLARLTQTEDYAMMLMNEGLRVIFASTHVPHRAATRKLSVRGIVKTLRLTETYLDRYMGIKKAKIGVAALNPHGGEGGRLGTEEVRVIKPAVMRAREEGILVEGPFPADSIYRPAFAQRFDAIIAMYHDQGMIPLKLMGHGDVINITLGIPCLRTSPGHGTAFDIAGKSKASERSMRMAILECARIAKRLNDAA
jgi:4-hydroxythreonine-4-phosphate dehydrogenase